MGCARGARRKHRSMAWRPAAIDVAAYFEAPDGASAFVCRD